MSNRKAGIAGSYLSFAVAVMLVLLSGCSDKRGEEASDAGTYALKRRGMTVIVTDLYTPCNEHVDCELVSNECSCCGRTAVRKDLVDIWSANSSLACEGYMGPICDCNFADVVARCMAGRCAAIAREDVAECISPFKNTEKAYMEGTVGCPCESEGQAICVEGVALICDQVRYAHLVWTTVEDGPCLPRSDTCEGGEIHPDAAACLAARDDCYQLPDGRYCAAPQF